MQTVLITGGTGLVGKNLARSLTEKGYNIIILTRKLPGGQAAQNIRYALWDVHQQQIAIDAVQQADHIIHLAGAGVMDRKWTAAYKKEIIDSRAKSAALLIDTLRQHAHKVKTFISASAIGYYGKDKTPVVPFEETDAPDTAFLGEVCRLWEESVEPVKELNIRLVKFRIGIVLGETGGALKEFITPLRFGIATILGNGKQVVSWIHLADLCRLFIYAIENEKMNAAYNAVAPMPVTNKKLILTLAKKRNGSFYIPIPVPGFVLKLALGGRSIEILKSATVSSKKTEAAGFDFQYATIEAALDDLVKKD
jgi:uncharacterized protein (TIGR01777 family)